MAFTNFNDMIKAVRERKSRKGCAIVAAESKRTLGPVLEAYRDGFIEPILIGNATVIKEYVEEIHGSLEDITIMAAETPENATQTAVDLVHEGRVACIMKGRIDTGAMMHVILSEKNRMRTDRIMSAIGVMEIPTYHKFLTGADGGIIICPDLLQKKRIIENAVEVMQKLGIRSPKVAVLAALEQVNPQIPGSVDARELRNMNERGDIKHCIVEGPISYDLAVVKDAVEAKGFISPVAGDADVLIWPDINTGNVTTKALIHSAKGRIAAYVFGAKVPILISSRSSPCDEKYLSLALAAL
jgi:phosphate butyryltransferase